MTPIPINDQYSGESEIRLRMTIQQAWIQRLANKRNLAVQVKDKYQLHHFEFHLHENKLDIKAEVVEKPGSVITLETNPRWDDDAQRLSLDDFKIDTKTKNLFLKSAAWIASLFFQEKIDKLIEEKVNDMFRANLDKILSKPFQVPFDKQGLVNVDAKSIVIQHVKFLEGKVDVDVIVKGNFNLHLIS